jgi:hypothetical protein
MIELVWKDKSPGNNDKAFKVKDINALILAANFPYDADGVNLTTYEHKNLLLRLHNKREDHLFSILDYHHEIMTEFADKITKSLIQKGCIIFIKTHDNEFIVATELGQAVNSGFSGMELSNDESNFLFYLIQEARQLNLMERYSPEDLEVFDGEDPLP